MERNDKSGTRRRLSVYEAADQLGITVDAVRGRIKRGTIKTVRDRGRVFVVLDDDQSSTDRDQATDQYTESNPLISQLTSEIEYLREENRRKDHLLAAALERIPALEEPSESPEPQAEGSSPTEAAEGSQEPAERRSWWRRILGE